MIVTFYQTRTIFGGRRYGFHITEPCGKYVCSSTGHKTRETRIVALCALREGVLRYADRAIPIHTDWPGQSINYTWHLSPTIGKDGYIVDTAHMIVEDAVEILHVLIGDREKIIGEKCEVARDLLARCKAMVKS
jgi:hypothetical protein